jgi:hypothetical protein
MGIRYRARQFMQALWGPTAPPELGEFAGLLEPPQHALFRAMAAVDQAHSLRVAAALAEQGNAAPDLLRAALIHDAGKATAQIAVWERVAHVLALRFSPTLVGRIGSPSSGFGHGLYVLAHHAEIGAALAAKAGFSPAVVALVHGDGDPAMQSALRRADDAN